MKRPGGQNNKGFTLIESIITIVVAAILATMMYTYSSTSLTKSAQPLNQSKKAMALQKVMESISADYNKNYTNDLATLKTKIEGASAQQLPPVGYGPYTLVYSSYIKFVGNIETPIVTGDPLDTLKVTIKNDLGETLSILLTKH